MFLLPRRRSGTLFEGGFTDEDGEIPSGNPGRFLLDRHRHLFEQDGSLILSPGFANSRWLKEPSFENLKRHAFGVDGCKSQTYYFQRLTVVCWRFGEE
jgi:hypothetical protein